MTSSWNQRVESYRFLADEYEKRAERLVVLAKGWLEKGAFADNYYRGLRLQVIAEHLEELVRDLRRYKTDEELEAERESLL